LLFLKNIVEDSDHLVIFSNSRATLRVSLIPSFTKHSESQNPRNRIRGAEDSDSESRGTEIPEAESQRNDSKTLAHYSNTNRKPLRQTRSIGV
jgi:hypothetical protein